MNLHVTKREGQVVVAEGEIIGATFDAKPDSTILHVEVPADTVVSHRRVKVLDATEEGRHLFAFLTDAVWCPRHGVHKKPPWWCHNDEHHRPLVYTEWVGASSRPEDESA